MTSRRRLARQGMIACSLGVGLFVLSLMASRIQDFTFIYPEPATWTPECLAGSAIVAGLATWIAWVFSSECSRLTRVVIMVLAPAAAGDAGFQILFTGRQLVAAAIDFPPGSSRTHTALMQIDSASRTDGRGRPTYTIETMTPVLTLKIGETDWKYLRWNRRSEDGGLYGVDSGGRFCAQVEVQVSKVASRVLHAGDHPLPDGSVRLCPD